VSPEQGAAPDREKLTLQPDGGWLRLLLSIVCLLFWASVVVIRFTMGFIAGTVGMALGLWFGYRLVQSAKHRKRESL
jgi:uncharacterized membrane protein